MCLSNWFIYVKNYLSSHPQLEVYEAKMNGGQLRRESFLKVSLNQ